VLTRLAAAAAIAASLSLAACGGDDKEAAKERDDHQATPAQAHAEAGTVREQLAAALATYKGGDEAAAAKQVQDAYLEHFEHVEGPLEARDEELNEELEHAIREDLVTAMKAGKPSTEVEGMVQDIDRDLVTAQAALR
jgi:hypothetical protein